MQAHQWRLDVQHDPVVQSRGACINAQNAATAGPCFPLQPIESAANARSLHLEAAFQNSAGKQIGALAD